MPIHFQTLVMRFCEMFVLRWNSRKNLSPNETDNARYQTPQPLREGQRTGGEPATVQLHDEDLEDEGGDPEKEEEKIREESLQDVPFSTNLSRIELIEKCHDEETVEDDGEMLRGRRVEGLPST
ncbi:hypothetical protein PFISCL1PPCAC_3224, partial [Pristionchus fissidentatus]